MDQNQPTTHDSKRPATTHRPNPQGYREWEFAGWGNSIALTPGQGGLRRSRYPLDSVAVPETPDSPPHSTQSEASSHKHKLGEWSSTAISGNDILSSCLYVTGLCAADAGVYAPVVVIASVFALWLYKAIYGEVGTALPMNGGVFNVLLHTTRKKTASLAACLSILSYVATCVVSASEAIAYLSAVFQGIPVAECTLALLFIFAMLVLLGVSESAVVALMIFVTHCVTLFVLVACSFGFLYTSGGGLFWESLRSASSGLTGAEIHMPTAQPSLTMTSWQQFPSQQFPSQQLHAFPAVSDMYTHTAMQSPVRSQFRLASQPFTCAWTPQTQTLLRGVHTPPPPGDLPPPAPVYEYSNRLIWMCFFGFSSAMLGLSGYESSSQFIQDQKAGVFVKTLRNMWTGVMLVNPVLSLLCVCMIPVPNIREDPAMRATVLAHMGRLAGGDVLHHWVCVDAFLVLSGSVLTAYVGVCGLVRRMAENGCLPEFLGHTNSARNTPHFVIVGFFAVCSSMYLWLQGEVSTLSRMYSLCFLSLLLLFAAGLCMLKSRRSSLARSVHASWLHIFLGMVMVATALAATVMKDLVIVGVFFMYFLFTVMLCFVMFYRIPVLLLLVRALAALMDLLSCDDRSESIRRGLMSVVQSIKRNPVVFFTKHARIDVMNRAVLYILENEECQHVYFTHVHEVGTEPPARLQEQVRMLDEIYPQIRTDLCVVEGSFGPEIINDLARYLKVPVNRMFIACPDERYGLKVDELGDVRLIAN